MKSSTWTDPESTAWYPESKTILDSLTGVGGGGNRRVIASWPLFPQELVECGFSWQNSDAELKKGGVPRNEGLYEPKFRRAQAS